jgi:hypothetical protein
MAERQVHGFDYQKRIIEDETLTEDVNYTGKWDAFSSESKLPVSIKCIGINGSVDFGDFRRQTEIVSDFILYVGFWKKSKSNVIEQYKVLIKKEKWDSYFGDKSIISSMMEDMKDISNDHSDDPKWKDFRDKYSKLYGNSIISLRFKRDHKKQKRIQCGITRKNFIEVVLKDNELMWKK